VTAAALAGIGWGAFHAVTAPDHVVSLAPACSRRGAWRIGLWWGTGHALGTLLWAAAASLAAHLGVGLLGSPGWDGALRVAGGLALVATGVLGWRRAAHLRGAAGSSAAPMDRPGATLLFGAVHGVTGATAVLLVLPMLTGDAPERFGWIGGFALGSTLAMSALTAVLGLGAVALTRRALGRAVAIASLGSAALGVAWIVA
jgi:nickel/cobalt transporter (NicO) family protein